MPSRDRVAGGGEGIVGAVPGDTQEGQPKPRGRAGVLDARAGRTPSRGRAAGGGGEVVEVLPGDAEVQAGGRG